MLIPKALRHVTDRYFPWAANAWRAAQDRRLTAAISAQATPYGFTLWGGTSLAAGFHEPAEVAAVLPYLDAAAVVIDVGANSGLYSCLGARRGKTVLAIEPMPGNLSVLYRNLEQNGLSELVEVLPIAASERPGIIPFYGRGQGASLIPGWGGASPRPTFHVPANSLDRLFAARFADRKVFLKVDVEGAELKVLRGAALLLRNCPAVLVEISLTHNYEGVNPQFADTFDFMCREMGYSAYPACEAPQRITPESIERWIAQKTTGLPGENFMFVRGE